MDNKESIVNIKTTLGDIKVKLYNETPLHRDNFLKLVKEDFYNNLLFHRVIKDFMVQGGDPSSRNAEQGKMLGTGDLGYTIPSEFNRDLYHKRGALAAARLGDQMNPTKSSSASQFYIVTGSVLSDKDLKNIEKQRVERRKQQIFNELQVLHRPTIKELYANGDKESLAELKSNLIEEAEEEFNNVRSEVLYTEDQKLVYTSLGGTPFLDGEYTVFGEVIEGLDIVDKIQEQSTNSSDRPIVDIVMSIEELK